LILPVFPSPFPFWPICLRRAYLGAVRSPLLILLAVISFVVANGTQFIQQVREKKGNGSVKVEEAGEKDKSSQTSILWGERTSECRAMPLPLSSYSSPTRSLPPSPLPLSYRLSSPPGPPTPFTSKGQPECTSSVSRRWRRWSLLSITLGHISGMGWRLDERKEEGGTKSGRKRMGLALIAMYLYHLGSVLAGVRASDYLHHRALQKGTSLSSRPLCLPSCPVFQLLPFPITQLLIRSALCPPLKCSEPLCAILTPLP